MRPGPPCCSRSICPCSGSCCSAEIPSKGLRYCQDLQNIREVVGPSVDLTTFLQRPPPGIVNKPAQRHGPEGQDRPDGGVFAGGPASPLLSCVLPDPGRGTGIAGKS